VSRLAGLVLAAGVALLGSACSASPCTAKVKAEIQARYAAEVLAHCGGKYPSVAACPASPALKLERRKAEEAAQCR